MKTKLMIPVLAVLLSAAMAQTPAPLTITLTTSDAQATNVSAKEIVLVTVSFSSKEQQDSTATHDYYFKPGGMAPGDIEEVIHPMGLTLTSVTSLFVQFADGSTWGDSSVLNDPNSNAALAISCRAPILNLLKGALSAYQSGRDQGLVDYLTNFTNPSGHVRSFAKKFLNIQKTSGTDAALAQIQQRLTTAQSRPF